MNSVFESFILSLLEIIQNLTSSRQDYTAYCLILAFKVWWEGHIQLAIISVGMGTNWMIAENAEKGTGILCEENRA